MVRDALSAERVVAMALLKPGWEIDYEASPEFHALGCLARFEEVEWLPNDCYQLVVAGLTRVRLSRIVKEFPYRAARVEIVPQEPYSEDDPLIRSERQGVLARLQQLRVVSAAAAIPPFLAKRLEPPEDTPYEHLVNHLCSLLEADPIEKLELLGMDSVIERGRRAQELAARR